MKFPNEFKWAIFNQSNSKSVLQWFQLIPAFHFCNLFQGKIAKKLQNEMRQTSSEWVQNRNEATGKSKPRRHAERRSNKSTGTRSRRQLTSKFDCFLAKTCFEMKWNDVNLPKVTTFLFSNGQIETFRPVLANQIPNNFNILNGCSTWCACLCFMMQSIFETIFC